MDRRTFLALPLAGVVERLARAEAAAPEAIRVVVWDEQQPAQKQAYSNFLGNQITEYLSDRPGIFARSTRLEDRAQGLSAETLDDCDVLVWWGHVRNREIKSETGKEIVKRVKRGELSLIALHSAHWSTPFIEAMFERARIDAINSLRVTERARAHIEEIAPRLDEVPKRGDPLTPSSVIERHPDGTVVVQLTLPNCGFPAYRADGKPSHFRVLATNHPIARGLPAQFDVRADEMYDEPFHVPRPDETIFEERWDGGERFRSGLVWKIGLGRVVYFRSGHETYPVFRQAEPLQILENAVRWLAEKKETASIEAQAIGTATTVGFPNESRIV
jgi:trehalose utilization protein